VDIPLVIRLPGMPVLARGLQVKLDLLHWDMVDLTVEARILNVAAEVQGGEDLPDDEDAGDVEGEAGGEVDAGPAADTQATTDTPPA
jgi:exoribonuclease-2